MDAPVDAGGSTFVRAIYFAIVMTVRSVVSPKAVVWTITVTEAWSPAVAPFGIDVVNVAVPRLVVVSALEAMTGTPGTARVNVTVASFSARPSGSVTLTVRVTGSGSDFALTE
jgi:hypothetical protein